MISILEYIKKTHVSEYDDFPSDLNDVQDIVKWLDKHNFNSIDQDKISNGPSIDVLRYGRPCYIMGRMQEPDTHWICISDGKQYSIMLRTHDENTRIYRKHGKISLHYFNGSMPHEVQITPEEMIQYINDFIKK